jgi:predicted acyl esterase
MKNKNTIYLLIVVSIVFTVMEICAQPKKHYSSDYYDFPSLPKVPSSNPFLYTVIYQTFNFSLRDNVVLDCGKYYPSVPDSLLPNGYPGIIMCHGYGDNRLTLDSLAKKQASFGYCVYTYSMRGQGNSGGLSNLISITEAQDLIEFVNYVKNDHQTSGVDSSKLLIMGGSQGGIIPYMAACNGLNVKTIISALASPVFATSWIENGSIKMTFLWTISYTPDSARYSPQVNAMRDWVYSSAVDKWDSLAYWLPINRNFLNKVNDNKIPILLENSWQDLFFNTDGNINSIPFVYPPKRYYFGAVKGHGGDSSLTESEWHVNFFSEWINYWLFNINNGILTRPIFHFAYTSFPEFNNMWSFVHDSSSVWSPNGIINLNLYFCPNGKLNTSPNSNNNENVILNNSVSGGLTMRQAVSMNFTGPEFDSMFQKSQLIFETNPLNQDLKFIGTPELFIDYESNTGISQFNYQVFEVSSTKAKLITRVNYTDRHNIINTRKNINVSGISHSHIFKSGNKIRVILTNLDTTPDDSAFLETNPHVLPVLQNGLNKLYLSNNSYISLPVYNTLSGIFSNNLENNIPTGIKLNQNCPNPFNPTTTIEYSIPKSSFVTLKVYDITGKEIASLVNSSQTAGNYKVYFNSNLYSLSSGVYFYRITASDFSQVRQMILIK